MLLVKGNKNNNMLQLITIYLIYRISPESDPRLIQSISSDVLLFVLLSSTLSQINAALTVEDKANNHKLYYVKQLLKILNHEGFLNCIINS